jgi:hypothetical protein
MNGPPLVDDLVPLRRSGSAPGGPGADPPAELDEHGDVIFRFRLPPSPDPASLTLAEYYEWLVRDLLRIVRFYHLGKPLMPDAFAFRNTPEQHISLRLPGEQAAP